MRPCTCMALPLTYGRITIKEVNMSNNVKKLQPTEVQYKDHSITLTHRPSVNDWTYTVSHTRTITLSQHAPRYDSALRLAKRDIDILLGDK